MELLVLLDDLCTKLTNRYDSINSGGCAVAAAAIAHHLKDIVPTRIAIDNYGDEVDVDACRNSSRFENSTTFWNHAGISFRHVVVEFEYNGTWFVMDSKGVGPTELVYRNKLVRGLSIQEVKELGDKDEGWNWWFNRDQIPGMKQMIGKHFAKIKREYAVDIPLSS